MAFKDEFAKLLGDGTIYNLSKNTGIERTKLHRIKSGTRQPSKEDIEKISRALCLTHEEKNRLYRAYEIDQIGAERFHCRELSMQFMNDITAICESRSYLKVEKKLNNSFEMHGEVVLTHGITETKATISALVLSEISAGSEINIYTDSQDELIFNELSVLIGSNEYLPEVKHLIAIKPIGDNYEPYFDIMNVIKGIYPVFINNPNYLPNYIYYSLDNPSFLPYYIITQNYSVNFGHNLAEAVIISNKELVRAHRRMFADKWNSSYSFLYEIKDIFGYTEYYLKILSNLYKLKADTVYSLEADPCLTFFVTEEIIGKYIKRNYENCDLVISRGSAYFTGQENLGVKKVIFRERGLDTFIKTGRIKEIPEITCTPFSVDDRIKILNRLITTAKAKEKYFPIMIKDDMLHFHENIRFYGTGCMEDMFILLRDNMDGFSSILTLNDSGMSIPFFDFVKSLENSEYVYTVDETIQIVQSKLDALIEKANNQ